VLKLAVAIASNSAPPSTFVVWRGFEQSIQKAARFGYHGVELALKTADDINSVNLEKWLSKNNVEVSCISTGQVFATLGLYFTHPDKDKRQEIINVFKGLIDLAGNFGKMVNVGRARGFIGENQTYEQAEKLFIETSETLCEYAVKRNVTMIIEPVNRYEINFINNLDEGVELLRKIKADNIGLMPDVFHMNIEDDKIGKSLVRNSNYVKYVHFADSNRLAPGNGHIDFDEIFNALGKINFDGWASIEILPKPNPDTAALQAAEYILPRIEKCNRE